MPSAGSACCARSLLQSAGPGRNLPRHPVAVRAVLNVCLLSSEEEARQARQAAGVHNSVAGLASPLHTRGQCDSNESNASFSIVNDEKSFN